MKANVQRQREADTKTAELLEIVDDVRINGMSLVGCSLIVDRSVQNGTNSLATRLISGLCKGPKIYNQHSPASKLLSFKFCTPLARPEHLLYRFL